MSVPAQPGVGGFRTRLLVAMMLVVSAITALALFFVQRSVAAGAERELRAEFQAGLDALRTAREIRHAALAERCRALVRKSRLHAALEDGALDLLYPSARDELRDLMQPATEGSAYALHAQFYRFLDRRGALIRPAATADTGALTPAEEAQLALPAAPPGQQLGYLLRAGGEVCELIAMPIISSENGEVIAALVFGFALPPPAPGFTRGLWLGGALRLAALDTAARAEIVRAMAAPAESGAVVTVGGASHLFFHERLNPGSQFPPADEVSLFPLAGMLARQRQLRWQIVGASALLLLGGLAASHFLSGRLSDPVEKLAHTSAENLVSRRRAEAALESTSEELQRSARFSADASHQLKTPVTVLRAGLEELLARESLTPAQCDEISALIHQTWRLSGVIEDLLLLSRLDAGRLQIEFVPVNLTALIEAALDDLGALPAADAPAVETDFPAALHLAGEQRYVALILQNLLENARKYNRPGGRIRLAARVEGATVLLTVANTGRPIPPEVQPRIFERFHRGAVGENVPGYGLGLNLARELARLHRGDLRLARSDAEWTEFEVRFLLAPPAAA